MLLVWLRFLGMPLVEKVPETELPESDHRASPLLSVP